MACGHRILLVDDFPDYLAAMECVMESWGCETRTATGPREALATVASWVPDVVVVDLGLPTIDVGLALIRDIRRIPASARIVIMAVTGYGREMDRRAAMNAGGDFFFLKPADLDELQAAVMTIDTHHRRVCRAR
jgi:CheY-like chemotaxis protein